MAVKPGVTGGSSSVPYNLVAEAVKTMCPGCCRFEMAAVPGKPCEAEALSSHRCLALYSVQATNKYVLVVLSC